MISSKGFNEIVFSKDGKDVNWKADIRREMPVKTKFMGPGSEQPTTIYHLMKASAKKFGDRPAMLQERNGEIIRYTYQQYF